MSLTTDLDAQVLPRNLNLPLHRLSAFESEKDCTIYALETGLSFE